MTTVTERSAGRRYPVVAVIGLAAAVGVAMLVVGDHFLLRPKSDAQSVSFVKQELTAIPDGAREMAAAVQAELEISHVTSGGDTPSFGTLTEAVLPDGARVILDWAPDTEPPVLMRETRAAEEWALVEALRKHLPADATVLAMPEVSQRLSHFVPAAWPLAHAPMMPLAPGNAGGDADALARIMAERAGAPPSTAEATEAREALLDALLAEDAAGAARLRVLAGLGEAYVLVHLHDAFALGMIRPGSLPIERRSFTATSFSHDLAREAKAEMAQRGHAAYAIDRTSEGALRGHFLTEAPTTATLIAQLLPFNTSKLGEVPGVRLVYQTGGYWLYRIAAVNEGG